MFEAETMRGTETESVRETKEKEQKEAEEKAKELIDKAEKVIETLDGQKSSDDPPIIIVQVGTKVLHKGFHSKTKGTLVRERG